MLGYTVLRRVSGLNKLHNQMDLWHTELSSSRGVPKCGVHVYNWPGSDVLRTFKLPLEKNTYDQSKQKHMVIQKPQVTASELVTSPISDPN